MNISVTRTCQGRVACICIAGDVDLIDPADVSLAQRELDGVSCESLYVDLAGVTFGGAGLVRYLYLLARLPGVAVTLCGPSAITRELIQLTGLDQVTTLRESLPADWATVRVMSPAAAQRLLVGRAAPVRPQPAG